ncbi:MAG: NUDIX hydrolase [Candidatus Komeilibacteria bacterium]
MNSSLTPKDFFKYCPKCGVKYRPEDIADNCLHCWQCGYSFYQNPKATVGVLIVNTKLQVLLARRAKEPDKGTWGPPGGFVDWGEDPVAAIKREIREEMHVEFTPLKLLTAVHSWYHFGGLKTSVLLLAYRGTIEGDIKADDDVDALEWFPLDNLPPNLAFPNFRNVLEDLRKDLK